jgi:5'-nucleotidase
MPKKQSDNWPNEEDCVAHFDLDGSLANFNAALVRDLNLLRSPQETEITDENLWTLEKQSYIAERMRLIKAQPDWWFNLEPMQEGLAVLRLCEKHGFDIAVLTKGPGHEKHSLAWSEKLRWVRKHVGNTGVTITLEKSRVYGKILYDDFPEYMESWLSRRPRGLGIMPVNNGNANFSHPNVVMYHGTQDLEKVERAILAAKNRKPGEPLVLEQ